MSTKTIELTELELEHLCSLIEWNEREGSYYGGKLDYWRRSFAIKKKILQDIKRSYCPQCGSIHPVNSLNGFCSEECLKEK